MDEKYMQLAIQLANGVKGQTTPNPPVGAVVVKNGAVIGFGAHLQYGKEHAEVIALDMAKEQAIGATMYTTLEPCSHFGKTPPCAELIIKKKIKRVVIACQDRHKKVSGKGIALLKAAGIDVEVGLLEKEATTLYGEFFYSIQTGFPFITVKTAMSLDGKIASHTGESKWITNEAARMDGHMYRHGHDAILVGINTVLHDNPSLTTRLVQGKSPIRIILDTHLKTPIDATIVNDEQAETWIFVGNKVADFRKEKFSDKRGVHILTMPDEELEIEKVLHMLTEKQVSSVLVEGGGEVNDAFLRGGFINQMIVYIAPKVIGGKQAKTAFSGIGFARLEDAWNVTIDQIEMIEHQVKIVATRKEET